MSFDQRSLVLPAGTRFEERTIVTEGDAILGNHVKLAFGVRTSGRVFTGQGVEIDGNVDGDLDVRLDASTHVLGDLRSGANVYLAERCFIQKDLHLDGDLDVGDDVKIGGQLKAQGWVQRRNPLPLVFYVLLYMLELLRLGKSDEVERILKEMEEQEENVEIAVDETFLYIPDDSAVGLDRSVVKGGLIAGDNCRILGNWRIDGDVRLDDGCVVYGALRATGSIHLGANCEIQGNLESGGAVTIASGAQVLGDLSANTVDMYAEATVDGKIHAEEGVQFHSEKKKEASEIAEEKVAEDRDSKAADLVDLLD